MRSHEERVAETKRRIAKIEREKRLRRNTITMASTVAACLALLIGASLAMPGIAASIRTGDYSGFETAASIFHGGAALGYIIIGLLAFLLGVCVTVLCFRIRQFSREDAQDKESEDAHGADGEPAATADHVHRRAAFGYRLSKKRSCRLPMHRAATSSGDTMQIKIFSM